MLLKITGMWPEHIYANIWVGFYTIAQDCTSQKLLHIDQEKCETLYRVAQGTVMFALDFIYDYLGLHCNAHCC